MNTISVYNDFLFEINKDGGYLSESEFNGISKRAELKFLDWISGKLSGEVPQPYTTQKVRDWLSIVTKKVNLQVNQGKITKPDDYYGWENAFLLGDYYKAPDCEDDDENIPEGTIVSDCNVPIELLSNNAFYTRCNTSIKGLQPSFTKPICKMVGNEVEFVPKDMGSITVEYIRYPVYAELKMILDTVYNNMVPDPATTINYEWPEFAREYIIWFLIDIFSNSIREQSLKEFNATSKP